MILIDNLSIKKRKEKARHSSCQAIIGDSWNLWSVISQHNCTILSFESKFKLLIYLQMKRKRPANLDQKCGSAGSYFNRMESSLSCFIKNPSRRIKDNKALPVDFFSKGSIHFENSTISNRRGENICVKINQQKLIPLLI